MQKKGVQGCFPVLLPIQYGISGGFILYNSRKVMMPSSVQAYLHLFFRCPVATLFVSLQQSRRQADVIIIITFKTRVCLFLNENLLFALSVTLIPILSILKLSSVKSFG